MNEISICEIPWRKAPMELLLEADPNPEKILAYLPQTLCIGIKKSEGIIGVCVLLETGENVFELMNIAILPRLQKQGCGRRLLQETIRFARKKGAKRLELGTGSFGYQLAFYQREGFRVFKIEKDFFLINYPEPIHELGIQLKDMLRLYLDLGAAE